MSWDFFIEENLQEAYWSKYCWLTLNFRSHAIKRRERSIERGVNLYVVIEYLKKNADTSRSKQANNSRDLQIILKLLSCRQLAWTTRLNNFHGKPSRHATDVGFANLCMEMLMVVSDNDNTILIYFRDSSTVFSLIELLIFALKRERRISHL